MIVDQINIERVALFKAKDEPPIAADCDTPKAFKIAL
jgi:hypothetical protein